MNQERKIKKSVRFDLFSSQSKLLLVRLLDVVGPLVSSLIFYLTLIKVTNNKFRTIVFFPQKKCYD